MFKVVLVNGVVTVPPVLEVWVARLRWPDRTPWRPLGRRYHHGVTATVPSGPPG